MRAIVSLLLVSCAAGPAASYGGAAMMTGISVAQTAIYRKATGYSCWAACQQGYACNKATSVCERLPCAGACMADEHCEVSGASERCLAATHREEEIVPEQDMCGVPDASPLLRVPCEAGAD